MSDVEILNSLAIMYFNRWISVVNGIFFFCDLPVSWSFRFIAFSNIFYFNEIIIILNNNDQFTN
jgi:hypothetical protein